MFSLVRRRVSLVHIGLVVALVLAMSGGAYAASKFLITSTKQIKPSVLAQLKGKAGKTGGVGPAGPQGGVGPAGPQGGVGPAGPQGAAGTNGGKGEKGEKGETGVTGFTKFLPPRETETGEWSMYVPEAPSAYYHQVTAVSFNIPLAKDPIAHYLRLDGKEPYFDETTGKEAEREQSACPGNVESPKALPGNLCVYASVEENLLKEIAPFKTVFPTICSLAKAGSNTYGSVCLANTGTDAGADKYGFDMTGVSEVPGELQAAGTWAATAAEE